MIERGQLCPLANHSTFLEFLKVLGLSRNQAKKFVDQSKELQRPLKIGDVVDLSLNLLNSNMINPSYSGPNIELIKDEPEFLAINKPAGVHCHPLSYLECDNLLSYLRSIGKYDILNVNRDAYDRGLLFRLDYETSGVVLVAKTDQLYHRFRQYPEQFKIEKNYLAICSGEFPEEKLLSHCLTTTGKKVKVIDGMVNATLEAKRIDFNPDKNLSLLEIKLHQGRRHQIRVQLAEVGFPILGDTLYGGIKDKRIYLHSKSYSFTHPHFKAIQASCMAKDFTSFF